MSLATPDLADSTPALAARPRTAADWLAALGNVPLDRILFDPPSGTATEADALMHDGDVATRCQLIDGTLVVKTTGWEERIIEANIARVLGNFMHERKPSAAGRAR